MNYTLEIKKFVAIAGNIGAGKSTLVARLSEKLGWMPFYEAILQYLPPPDLVIYLCASVEALLSRISLRGREYERGISREYLTRLNLLYEKWIAGFTLCSVLTIPTDDLNFVENAAHLDLIVEKVQDKLIGKEEVVFQQEGG